MSVWLYNACFECQELTMKKYLLFCLVLLVLAMHQDLYACVGRILIIGISPSTNEQLLAEMVSQLLSERTGTNVKIVQFSSSRDMYSAVKKGEVSLVIESLERGSKLVSGAGEKHSRELYDAVKKEYRRNYNLVWFEPFGESRFYAPVVALDVLEILPALPKLLGKLGGVLNEDAYARLLKSVKSDASARHVAKEFLKSKRLI